MRRVRALAFDEASEDGWPLSHLGEVEVGRLRSFCRHAEEFLEVLRASPSGWMIGDCRDDVRRRVVVLVDEDEEDASPQLRLRSCCMAWSLSSPICEGELSPCLPADAPRPMEL